MLFNSIYLIIFCLIELIDNQLIVKPSETVISRDQYKPFIALCTGQRNTRVVSWRSPLDVEIHEDVHQRVSIERRNSGLRLRFRNLTEEDQGAWKCLGFNEYEQLISQNFQINVKIPINFVGESTQYAQLDSSILLKCHINSNPSAEITWFKGRQKSVLNSTNYIQNSDGLYISRVSSKDNDVFWCQADVIETGESKDFPIQLVIAQSISAIRVTCLTPCGVEKRTTTLVCDANGTPSPEYSWSYGQNIPFTVDGVTKYITRGNRLIINYVDETDNGRYTCHAFNSYDQNGQKKDYSLNVIIPPIISPIPQIEISMNEESISRSIRFSCRLQRGSIENLSFQWFYANQTLIESSNGISIENSPRSSELIFRSVHREYHGNYTCSVKNPADTTSVIARLLVQYKPVYIGAKIHEVYSVNGRPVIMNCQFDSYPPPILQWTKISEDGEEILIDDNNHQVIEIVNKQISPTIYHTQLTYNPIDDDFDLKFECRADNSRTGRHFLTLRFAQVPGVMEIPNLIPTSNSIDFNIRPPTDTGGLPILEYIVRYEMIDVVDSVNITSYSASSNDSQLISIENLRAATPYRIQIASRSLAGQSGFSSPVKAQTLLGLVPQFSLANNSCINRTTCLIKWIVDNDGGSSISNVQLFYAQIDRKGNEKRWEKPISVDPRLTEYLLTKLKSKKTYSIVVRLTNKAGFSERKIHKMAVDSIFKEGGSFSAWPIVIAIAIIVAVTAVLVILYQVRKYFQRKSTSNGGNNRTENTPSG